MRTSWFADGRWQRLWPLPLAAAYYLYLWWQDPSLQFEAVPLFPPFLRGPLFASPFLSYPGGPLEYVSAWLLQYLSYRWLGALLITALAAALGLGVDRLWRALSGTAAGWLALTPATMLLVLYHQLGSHGADVAGAGLALAGAAGYASLRVSRPALRALVFAGLSLALYYLVGPPYLLFVVLCAVVEARIGAGRLAGLLYLLSAEAVPQVIGGYLLDQGLARTFANNTPFAPFTLAMVRLAVAELWLLLIVLVALAALRRRPSATARPVPRGRAVALATLALVVLTTPVVLAARTRTAVALRVEQQVNQGQFELALRTARSRPLSPSPGELVFAVDYALYRLGRLSGEMFHYPQRPEGLVLGMICGPGLSPATIRMGRYSFPFQATRALLELGLVNQAEREACEALEAYGPHVQTLVVLARANLAKGRPRVARVYLEALARSPTLAGWARAQLAGVAADPAQSSNPAVRALREMMLTAETHAFELDLHGQCQALLRRNPHNRMAFEYLLTYCLLNRRLDEFATLVEQLPAEGYSEVPRHWQEALAVYQALSGRVPELPGYSLDPALVADFARFSGTVVPLQQRGDLAAARRATREEFGNTYFYYYVFGVCGEGRR